MKSVVKFKFKKFSKIVAKLCKEGQIPLYNSKYSNKIFSNVQHLFLLVTMANTNFNRLIIHWFNGTGCAGRACFCRYGC